MAFSFKSIAVATTALAGVLACAPAAYAAEKTDFKIAWTIYAGWMPWAYAQQEGIVKKWADKYGLKIELVQVNDYIESVNQYTAGKFDGVTVASMDALTIPAAGGVDTTALLVGDYSNGNDGILLKNAKSLKEIKGKKVNLVELSVSHYLLARALDSIKLSEKDIKTVNTSDADIVAVSGSADATAIVTWNPQLSTIAKQTGYSKVFDSSKIPGEIMDLTVVNTQTLKDNPKLGKALAGAWFETLALMGKNDPAGQAARAEMAKLSGTDTADFESQLKTTYLFSQPKAAADFTRSSEAYKAMDLVRTFSFDHALLGEGAKSKDAVGISFPGGKVLGDSKNVKLRFDDSYEQMAADGKL